MGLSYSEDRMIVAGVIFHDTSVCGRTVGRSDGGSDRIYHSWLIRAVIKLKGNCLCPYFYGNC